MKILLVFLPIRSVVNAISDVCFPQCLKATQGDQRVDAESTEEDLLNSLNEKI